MLATAGAAQSGEIQWGGGGEPSVACSGANGSDSFVTDGVDVTITWSEFTNGPGGSGSLPGGGSALDNAGCDGENFATLATTDPDEIVGGLQNMFLMGMAPADDNRTDGMSVVITFDPPLIGLTFTLGDVDQGSTTGGTPDNWRDLVRVEARDDANAAVLPTTQTLGDGGSSADNTVAQDTNATRCPGDASGTERCFRGITANNSPNNQEDGNVELTYASGNVASITITYLADDVTGGGGSNNNPTEQFIAVGALTWTNTLPVVITSFESEVVGSETFVRWTTEFEALNAGFRVLGLKGGRWRELATVPASPGVSGLARDYQVAVTGDFEQLTIEDVDLVGRKQRHGTFEVGRTYGERPQPQRIDWRAIKASSALVSPLDRVRDAAAVAADPVLAATRARAARVVSAAKKDKGHQGGGPTPEGARLLVAEPGIQKITYEGLLAAGVDFTGVASNQIAVTDRGRTVLRHVGGGNTFGPGSWIEFVAEPVLSPWSPVDAFVVSVDSRLARSPQRASSGGKSALAVQTATYVHDQDRFYSSASPNGDPFYDAAPQARPNQPNQVQRSFDLPNLVSGRATLRVDLWGGADHPGSDPDHHVRVLLNGVELGDHRFDGIVAKSFSYDVGGLLLETGNLFVLELPGDNGQSFDIVHLDGFAVQHSRQTVAQDGRFAGDGSSSAFAVGGLAGAPATGWLVRGSSAFRFESSGGATVTVPGWRSGASAWVAQIGAEHVPGVEPGVPEPATATSADYVIIAHPSLANDLDDLVALQESRGFDVAVATTDRIYAAYSDHQEHPQALFEHLSRSARAGGARYVLLVGGTTYDPYDHLGLGSVSLVPTEFVSINIVRFSPTDEPLVDFDRNGVPDAAIGRLPVRTATELQHVVAKLWAYSAEPLALLTSGKSPIAGQLPELNVDYGLALAPWQTSTSDVDAAGTAAVKADILAAFGPTGPSLVSFVGHSSPGRWDFTPVLRWQDVASFTNHGRPLLVTQWGCWNSYYVAPDLQDMSTNLLLAPEVGAVATIGATTLTNEASHQALGATFFAAVGGGADTLGEAWLAAKRALAQTGAPLDALYGMALLGDPATPLPALGVVKSLPQGVWTRAGAAGLVRQPAHARAPHRATDRD